MNNIFIIIYMLKAGPTMNNFLAFLIEFSFSILFLILFIAVHYILINKTNLRKKLKESKAISFWYFFGIGAIMSLVTFVVSQATALSIDQNVGLSITLVGLIVAMTFFYNRSVQIGAIIPTIISVIWAYDGFNQFSWAWASRLILVIIIAVVSISATFFKTKKWPTYLIMLAVIAGATLGIMFGFNDADIVDDSIQLALAIVSSILFYWILERLNKILDRMNYMAKTNLYTDEGYIIPSAIDNQFRILVKDNHFDQALVVTFDIKDNNKNALSEIVDRFKNKDNLLFKTQYGTYGVILSNNIFRITNLDICYKGNDRSQRMGIDPLAILEQDLKDLDVLAFVSIYGIHSNSLKQLLWFNQFAIKQFDKSDTTNKVQLFDSNMLNNQNKDEISYALLKQKINLKDIEVVLETIKFNSNNQKYIYPRFYWTKEFTCDLNQIIYQFDSNTADTLLRNLAIKSIEAYSMNTDKSIPLLINYPIFELSNPFFATNQFIKKLKLYGLEKTDIVLSFDCKRIKVWSNTIIHNLNELEHNGISYMFVDLNNTYPLSKTKPKFVILDDSISSNKIKNEKALSIINQYKINVLLSK